MRFPKTLEDAAAGPGAFRAGATDLAERRRHRLQSGPLVDLRDVQALDEIVPLDDGGVQVGAMTSIAALAEDPLVQQAWPGLAQTAGGLATPQIRNRGTVGGNLLQEVRCWYYRSPRFVCLKKGGAHCLARDGDHLFHSCFDQGPCAAPHPSSLAVALQAFDARVSLHDGRTLSIPELIGDGRAPTRTHRLEEGALLTGVTVPPPIPGARSAYFRAIHRVRAEWPLVEVVAHLVLEGEQITQAHVVLGGVANTPRALPAVEAALVGGPASAERLAAAAKRAAEGANPLPMTAYKLRILPGAVLSALERATERA
ncbi:MAG: FAD binding domain-containing protein [Alphaproteobacteria bacterium]|nr:FAD binding domain-containing protein [Alphaproteobacteria bacterium]